MIFRWMPWKFLLQRAAHHYGFIDPVSFMARLRNFAQPSEVQEPIELLRAGVSFHARGLLNTKAIQNNLDWVWPYWVEKQFNPKDASFIPRAFSFTHVNLTHRNWTAVGHPQLPLYPIVDPRGLVTPLFDGWSIDLWLLSPTGERLLPSKLEQVQQRLEHQANLVVETIAQTDTLKLQHKVSLEIKEGTPTLIVNATGTGPKGTKLVVALRPYNPEGIQFIEDIDYCDYQQRITVNQNAEIYLNPPPVDIHCADYHQGDVIHCLSNQARSTEAHCKVGMATAAALFDSSRSDNSQPVSLEIPLARELQWETADKPNLTTDWTSIKNETCQLEVPDNKIQGLYDTAVKTLILLSAKQTVPGPYTYFRFWFRDACLMLNALLTIGEQQRVRSQLLEFPRQQTFSGYFQSQAGEWDSNGQALWIFDRYEQLTNRVLGKTILKASRKAADWIKRKRLPEDNPSPHAGLLPPGFSAEHFGPNDYYYWDDFWSVAGLKSAARLCERAGELKPMQIYRDEAKQLMEAIERSLRLSQTYQHHGGLPASPYRRMDSGAIGSLVADYPLQLYPAHDNSVKVTADYLMDRCFFNGGFFQDMIHSGINAYLTLDIAQTLLRQGDIRYRDLIKTVAQLASATGHWPEAIHPITGGGCMGDGQHGWAAAEWVMMIRNLFVREEENQLIIGSGLFPEWLNSNKSLRCGPTLTSFGAVTVVIDDASTIKGAPAEKSISITGDWFSGTPPLTVAVPGFKVFATQQELNRFPLQPEEQQSS